MRRRERPLDPEVATGLAALDAALSGERPDREINLIAEEARAWAPPMTPAFAATLDHAVAAGFPPPAVRTKPRPAWGRWMPAAGLACAVLIALVVVVATHDSASEQAVRSGSGAGGSGGGVAATPATAPDAAKQDATAAGSAGASELQAPSVQRRVERAAELTLTTPAAKLQDTAD